MFLAGALMPDYFTPRINLAIMLAPVAVTAHIEGPIAIAAHHLKSIQITLVDVLHIYNIVAPVPLASEGIDAVCKVLPDVCKFLADALINQEVMNVDRFPMAATNLPSGQSWRTFAYYAQMIVSGNYALYDYGKKKNNEIYGQDEPKLVPIEDYSIPTALMSGDLDVLAVPIDVEWITQTLGENAVFHKQYHLNHAGFCIANDMSFFSVDAVNLLAQYNPTSTNESLHTFLS